MYSRVRDIGTIDMDEVSTLEAVDVVTGKPVIFKQFDLGSTIWFDLNVDYNTKEGAIGGEAVFVTFKLLDKSGLKAELVKTTDGQDVCVLCGQVDDYRLELKPPMEVMNTAGKYSFEIVFIDEGNNRLTSRAITFTIQDSIMGFSYEEV